MDCRTSGCTPNWDSDYEQDRIQTINQLTFVTLPQGIMPGLSPENPIVEIYRYTVQGPDHDLVREKEVEDWICEKQLKTVPGVLDVSGFGGLTKEYHVDIDPAKLNHYAIPLSQVIAAIQNSNTNAGGNYLNLGEQAFDVRGIGLIHSLDDMRDIVLATNKSAPIRISNVADVSMGWSPRLGIVGMNNDPEVVEGIVLMRKHGNTLQTLKGVEKKVRELNTTGMLPRGYRIVPYYDRTGLVYTTLRTVLENLALGMVLVFLVLIFFLGNLRAALIAAINIPLAMLGAFIVLYLTGTSANLLSLGAVDFGIIIDSTIIVVENIYRHLSAGEPGDADPLGSITRASTEVGGPMFYSTLIFLIAFLPLFTMQGVEGAIFSPMSHTYAYALTIAILLAVMLSPALFISAQPGNQGNAQLPVGSVPPFLPQSVCAGGAMAARHPADNPGDHRRRAFLLSTSGRRISAQAGGRQHLGARDHALDDKSSQGRRTGYSDARGVHGFSGGRHGGLAAWTSGRRH